MNSSRVLPRRLITGRRPREGAAEWIAVMVRGLDALEFLERSRDLAAEAVHASPPPSLPPPTRNTK